GAWNLSRVSTRRAARATHLPERSTTRRIQGSTQDDTAVPYDATILRSSPGRPPFFSLTAGNLPVTTALVTEFLPTNDRANILCATAGIFWGIGMIFASLLGLMLANVLGPGKEEAMWRWFLGVAALPSAIVAVAYRLLPESPRFLQVMGRHDEAMQMTMTLSLSLTDLDSGGGGGGGGGGEAVADGIGDAASHGQEAENAEAGDVRELFHTPILRRITLSFYFGVTFLLPRYYDKISGGQPNFVYILSALVGATFIPGAFAAMWLCSERRLGRVGALKWSSYATAAAVILLATTLRVKALFAVASILTLFITTIPGTVKYVLTPEIYSTKYRTVGLGSTSVVTRLGGLLAPVLAEVLYDGWGPVAPLLVFGPIMVITGIAAGMIPVETAGRQLDDDSWDRKEPAKAKFARLKVELSAAPCGA
ncbi:unnamed protein product, partial [Ectocarpus sp. 6 AP-2014]